MSINHEAVRAVEAAMEKLDEEWMEKRGALEDALEVLKGNEAPKTRAVVKRRSAEENDADVLAYLRQSEDFTDFTETEVAKATGIAQASVQASLERFADAEIVVPTDERRHGRGHTRASKVWRVVKLPPPIAAVPPEPEPEAIA